MFSFVLFCTQTEFIRRAVAGGVDTVIVDWENKGKEERQSGRDTEINSDTPEDLRRVRQATYARVLCRINSFGPKTEAEVAEAIGCGADEILLPMVREAGEVQEVLRMAAGRCGVGILVETLDAVERAGELGRLPLSRVYAGLHDLSIERDDPNLFSVLLDGTLERIRGAFQVPFGFGGLTLPDCGSPVPCRLLIAEMMRLGCDYSFLRRSFRADVAGRDLLVEIPRLRAAVVHARNRNPAEIAGDRHELTESVASWDRSLGVCR